MARPKIKANGKQHPVVLAEAVAECAKIVTQLRELDTLQARKLSATAFRRQAHKNAYPALSPKEAEQETVQLEAKVAQGPTNFEEGEVGRVLRRMILVCRSPNWCGPPVELRRLNFVLTPEGLAGLVGMGTTTLGLFCLAAKIATTKYPDDFGECESTVGHETKLLELAERRDALFKQIETGYSTEDLTIGPVDNKGRSEVSFKMTKGQVLFGPDLGQRLVNWVINEQAIDHR